jgi:hypothetical protein
MMRGPPHHIRQRVEHGAVLEDELGERREPRQAGAPGRPVRALVAQPAAVLEHQAAQARQLPQACMQGALIVKLQTIHSSEPSVACTSAVACTPHVQKYSLLLQSPCRAMACASTTSNKTLVPNMEGLHL